MTADNPHCGSFRPPRPATFPELWRDALARHAGRPLVSSAEDGGSLSYAEAGEIVATLALRLAGAGVGKGDRISLIAPLNAEALLVCWAALGLGAVLVPLDYRLAPEETSAILGRVEPSLLFCSRDFAAAPSSSGIPTVFFDDDAGAELPGLAFSDWLCEPAGAPGAPIPPAPGDPAVLLFTSGTSGPAKGVLLSQGALCGSGRLMAGCYGWHSEDVLFNLGELHTMSGFRNPCLAVLHAGCSLVVASPAVRSNALLAGACIERHRVSLLGCVPAMVKQFTRSAQHLDRGALVSLRLVLCTGSNLSASLAARFESGFGVPVLGYYGLTETGGLCAGFLPGRHEPPGSIGIPLGCAVRIVDDRGVPVGAGETGELAVRSDQLMTGYWRDRERTDRVLRDGWLHTGDLVRQEGEGSLILVSRKGEEFKDARGEFIDPNQIEQLLEAHPLVLDAGVTSYAAASGEEGLAAFIVPRGDPPDWGQLELELRALVLGTLGAHRTPARVIRVPALPRGNNGKLSRQLLKGLYHEYC